MAVTSSRISWRPGHFMSRSTRVRTAAYFRMRCLQTARMCTRSSCHPTRRTGWQMSSASMISGGIRRSSTPRSGARRAFLPRSDRRKTYKILGRAPDKWQPIVPGGAQHRSVLGSVSLVPLGVEKRDIFHDRKDHALRRAGDDAADRLCLRQGERRARYDP